MSAAPNSPISESTCRLAGDRLAGIVTAAATSATSARGACVLVNAGLVPEHGPFRLYTELARRLARAGYTTLRFDLGGLGDSAPSASHAPLAERSVSEIGAAVDHLVAAGAATGGVVVGGLCSGAEDAFRYAESDPRVSGVVLVDPFAYRTPGWYPRDFVRRATGKALKAAGAYEPLPVAPRGTRLVDYQYLPRSESARILATLVARGTRVHFVYTGGSADKFNHARPARGDVPGRRLRRPRHGLDHLPAYRAHPAARGGPAAARRGDWRAARGVVRLAACPTSTSSMPRGPRAAAARPARAASRTFTRRSPRPDAERDGGAAEAHRSLVDDLAIGCVTQVKDQGACIARVALIAAQWPEDVTGYTMNRFCDRASRR